MKEKDRLKNLLDLLKANRVRWAIEIHGGKIWHAILAFPDGTYARGYAILADMDAYIPGETKLMRGPLISLGRGLKAYNAKQSVAPVVRNEVLALLSKYQRPNEYLSSDRQFYKGQYGVLHTKEEEWLLQRKESQPDPLVSYLCANVPRGQLVDLDELIRKMRADKSDAYLGEADFERVRSINWMQSHGFRSQPRWVIRRIS